MMMHSNVLVVLMSCLMAGGTYAATPFEAFKSNREAVLSGQCLISEGCRFGIGTATPKNSSTASEGAAKEKARLQAQVNLICRKAAEGIAWPDAIGPSLRPVLAACVASRLSLTATVSGVETVYSSRDDSGRHTVVVAAPESSLEGVRGASFADVQRLLLDGHWLKRHMSGPHAKELYEFYLTQKPLPDALKGTEFMSWNEIQMNLFCGLPPPVVSSNCQPTINGCATNNLTTAAVAIQEEEEEIHPEFILPPYATGNENETIGF